MKRSKPTLIAAADCEGTKTTVPNQRTEQKRNVPQKLSSQKGAPPVRPRKEKRNSSGVARELKEREKKRKGDTGTTAKGAATAPQ